MDGTPHDAHLAAADPAVRARLAAIQAAVEAAVPGAVRCTGYRMPAYRTGTGRKRVFLYFAAFRKHVGLYPPVDDPALAAALAPYRGPRGNLAFPHAQELPIELIGRIAAALARQYES